MRVPFFYRFVLVLAAVGLLVVAMPTTAAASVDPLRGRWDLAAELPEIGSIDLQLLVTDVAADPNDAAAMLATGCLVTVSTGASTPMSLRSVDQGDGTAELTFFGTILRDDVGALVAGFTGSVAFAGRGVSDDAASGDVQTDFGPGTWVGEHHDRRRPMCAEVEVGAVNFGADAYTAQNAQDPQDGGTILEGFTQFVSSGMLVESASVGAVVADPFTDIFTPGVDFVSEFRFIAFAEQVPMIGEEFQFTLLDVFGTPIPGATGVDVWNGCFQGAPQNIAGTYSFEQAIELTWDPVAPVPGFDPSAGEGFYQIESDGGYGAASITVPEHHVPWTGFGGGADGLPDGFDFGSAVSEFGDGTFSFDVISFSNDVGPGGVGTACQVRDQSLMVHIEGSDVFVGDLPTFLYNVQGNVTNPDGDPWSDVYVSVPGNDGPIGGGSSDENGFYSFDFVGPEGTYTVDAGFGDDVCTEPAELDEANPSQTVNFVYPPCAE